MKSVQSEIAALRAQVAKLEGVLRTTRNQVVGFMIECGYSPESAVSNVSHADKALASTAPDAPQPDPFAGHCCVPRKDEPFFVLLGRDKQAPAAVERWAADRETAKPGDDKVAGAREIAGKMRAYSGAAPPPARAERSEG